MSQVINTNIPSINAQRNLARSGSDLATALQRLSSGLRINSAKDDAAGLAISERFTTQIRGLAVAVRNANDGISLSQTAEGALAEVTSNLQRIRELAVQSRNATNSASDRAALDAEVQQRLAEIDRTAAQTSFNGQKILDGTFGRATFQVGANAGETISLTLDSSMRLGELGKIATTTSGGIGADATGGSITLGAVSNYDFSAAGSPDGSVDITASTYLFDNVPNAGTAGTLSIAGNVNADVDFTTAGAVPGIAVMATPTTFDYSGANLTQFDVTVGGSTIGITLNTDVTDATGLAAAVDAQIDAVLGAGSYASVVNGQVVLQSPDATAPAVSALDANATTYGFAFTPLPGDAVNDATSFEVDGIAVTLNAAYADDDAVAAAIQGQLNGGGGNYTVSATATGYDIQNNTVGSGAPVIVATNASAFNKGFVTPANLTSTAGTPAVSANSIEFVVDGTTITLDDTTAAAFASFDDVASYIGTQLGAGYTVTADTNQISIVNNDGITPVAITASADAALAARAAAAGFGPTTGAFSGAATFEIDGQAITLNGDYSDIDPAVAMANLAAAIDAQLTGYTAAVDGGAIVISNDTLGSPAVAIANADANAIAAGIVDATGVAGSSEGEITLTAGQLTIAVPPSDTVDMAGEYATPQALADAINSNVSSVFARIDENGALELLSAREFTIGGTAAASLLGFTPGTFAPADGSLSGLNVLTAENADEVIVRADAALTAVSSLRSNFGAIQNRFESTIANLQITSENLTASRSRILDADFAQETANLTRGQILQQAGTAILAQANQLPQNVLSLLRG